MTSKQKTLKTLIDRLFEDRELMRGLNMLFGVKAETGYDDIIETWQDLCDHDNAIVDGVCSICRKDLTVGHY